MSKIKELLQAANMSASEAATYLRIPKRTMQDWVSDKRHPSDYIEKMIEEKLYPIAKQHLKTWNVKNNNGCDFSIAGFDLIDAITRGIGDIINSVIPNIVVGITLTQIVACYKDDILGGKGGCQLKIKYYHDPTVLEEKDPNWQPKEKEAIVWIRAKEGEIESPHEFDIVSYNRTLDDFLDDVIDTQYFAGLAIIDTISKYTNKPMDVPPFARMSRKYPTMLNLYPELFWNECKRCLQSYHPRKIPQLDKLWDTLAKIEQNFVESGIKKINQGYIPSYYHCKQILKEMGFEVYYQRK